MSDLGDELQRIASEAAQEARPLPVAQVMRLGGRRRRRRVARDALAAVAVAGAIVAGVLYNSSAGIHPEHQRPASPVAPPTGPSTKPPVRSPAPTLTPLSPGSEQPAPSPTPSARISARTPSAGP